MQAQLERLVAARMDLGNNPGEGRCNSPGKEEGRSLVEDLVDIEVDTAGDIADTGLDSLLAGLVVGYMRIGPAGAKHLICVLFSHQPPPA